MTAGEIQVFFIAVAVLASFSAAGVLWARRYSAMRSRDSQSEPATIDRSSWVVSIVVGGLLIATIALIAVLLSRQH